MEKIVVEIGKNLWDDLLWFNAKYAIGSLRANEDYIIKEVKIEDDLFKDDTRHQELKKMANKAYKALKKYEFKTRNK